jgi:carbonic anhydrase/acetyltransferase-like protein (isoleucine patch superfamily)
VPVYEIGDRIPKIHPLTWIAPGAHVLGRVALAQRVNIWFNAVLRGDNEWITIDEGTNVQEGAVLHTDPGFPMNIGKNVTVGHQAMLHGCTVGDGSLIGIKAIILDGASIGKGCLIGAGALVTGGKVIPDHSLVLGSPGKVVRTLTDEEVKNLAAIADNYVTRSMYFEDNLIEVKP